MIKISLDLDFFKKRHSSNLKLLSHLISANPLIIAYYGNQQILQNDTIYNRHDIPAISIKSLKNILTGKIPIVKFTHRGGVFVRISPSSLKNGRMNLNLNNINLNLLV